MFGLLDIQYVQVTAQYSNAVLLAIMPHINEFARKLDLSALVPIIPQQISAFACDNHLGEIGGRLALTNGCIFGFQHGHVKEFKTPDRYFEIEDFDLISRCYGSYHMTKREAVRLCRDAIRKLGYTEDALYADLDPQVRSGGQIGTNTIPRYLVTWVDPRDGSTSCSFEVNAEKRRLESIYFLSQALWRAPPTVDVQPTAPRGRQFRSRFQPVSLDYSRALLPVALSAVDDYARRLGLPLQSPVSSNTVASYICRKFDDEVYVRFVLTNGYRFFYQHGMIEAFDAPDAFFDLTAPVAPVKTVHGTWRLGPEQSIELARSAIQKLGYKLEPLGMDKAPELDRPHNAPGIPRFRLDWINANDGVLSSRTVVEVDADHGTIKSIAIWNPSLYHAPPDLGVSPDVPQVRAEPPSDDPM